MDSDDCLLNETSGIFHSYLFSQEELEDGAIAIHVFITVYMFLVLAGICEHYFVPCIEMLAKDFKIPSNVAGASLMASAASIPQLANTMIGMFIAKDDIGVGAVVGSAFFSVLLIPAICGLAVKGSIQLRCLPMTRDCVTYLVASIVLVLIIYDSAVYWYESIILILIYGLYIIIMVFNNPLENLIARYELDKPSLCCAFLACKKCLRKSMVERDNLVETLDKSSFYKSTDIPTDQEYTGGKDLVKSEMELSSCSDHQDHMASLELDPDAVAYRCLLTLPNNKCLLPYWLLMLPANLLLYFTIPDPRKPGCWRRLYGLTLFMSVLYIALTSYVLIWMISVIGHVIGASAAVMGMSLLAIGSSLPDAFNSVFAARDGYGEMALANTMGSINFDILFCLGFPWLIRCIQEDIGYVTLDENLTLVTMCLICSSLFIIIIYLCTGWRIDLKVSIVFLLAYAVFIVSATWFTVENSEQQQGPC